MLPPSRLDCLLTIFSEKSITTAEISSIFTATRLLEEKIEREEAELRQFLERKGNIPKEVQSRVRQYMAHVLHRAAGYNEQALLEKLPPAMARELLCGSTAQAFFRWSFVR